MAESYLEVALPVPLRRTFTYAVPPELEPVPVPGCRVLVPFRSRVLVGLVLDRMATARETGKLRAVTDTLDAEPALLPPLLALGRWIASYYLAPVGEVFRAMLPPEVELRRRRQFTVTAEGQRYRAELAALSHRSDAQAAELALLERLGGDARTLPERGLRRRVGSQAVAERLLRRGYLAVQDVAERRRLRTQKILAWNDAVAPAGATEERVHRALAVTYGPLPLPQLVERAGVSRAVVARLERQGRLRSWPEPLAVEEDPRETDFAVPASELNAEQRRCFEQVRTWLAAGEFAVGLLHGVTGSGKTEVYLRAVAEALARGRSALLLVPEIALTLRVGRLCRATFGDAVAVLHSALPESERARQWWRVRRGEARVVVGTRSAVFAPLESLGLIIVDEEHEAAYKQEETPRYHGRDTAVMRGKLEGAVVLLGSATPALESYQHARSGKYRLLRMATRVENRPLAAVEVVDLRGEFQRTHRADPLSEPLRRAIQEQLEAGTQVLLLLNRRGYARFLLCRSCGAAVQCRNCSIALTYHKQRDRLLCHYCGWAERVVRQCPTCGSEYIYFVGEGAEQIEERLRILFPRARIARLDRDTVRSRRAYQRVLGAFAAGETDILVGTQMLAKGHDFQRVTLVGVISADIALGLPDFRAAERTFQLLTQVAGRAGRGQLPGRVLVQTYYPEHYAIQFAARQDYEGYFEKESHFRRLLHYPPFTALANVLVRDRRLEQALRYARWLSEFFHAQSAPDLKVLGPATAPLARLRREYRYQFLLKSPRRTRLGAVLTAALAFCAQRQIPESTVLVDVDPQSLL
ncbi:MAG: primosomal protein N' [Firmicutes bacterium]|nr:primosomal protein N' [Bacillota bacterium]